MKQDSNYIIKDEDRGETLIKEFSNEPKTITKKADYGDGELWGSDDEKLSTLYFKGERGSRGHFGRVFVDYGSKREAFDIPRQIIVR